MTTSRTPSSRAELADLLTGAAHSISSILTTEFPTPAARSYLHPVLGPLTAGPQVVKELARGLEDFLDEPMPDTRAGLLTLASQAAALGWLTESLYELADAVDRICTQAGIPAEAPGSSPVPGGSRRDDDVEEPTFEFSGLELVALRAAARAAGLSSVKYVEVLSQSLLAAVGIAEACTDIAGYLTDAAAHVLDDPGSLRIDEQPGSLPAQARTLLARIGTAS
ncbi:hypothetical protein [Streptomyces sp. NPDC021020]|uniref:hypothetical protein n=1 Tax=Streptomyces sp. NPDC021020 TaxID=3365109 RepID=UPI0037A5B8E6